MLSTYYLLLLTLLLSMNAPTSCGVPEIPAAPECFPDINVWKIYVRHFRFSNSIRIKVLTHLNDDEKTVSDTVTTILFNIVSFTSMKTVELHREEVQRNISIEKNFKSLEIKRNIKKKWYRYCGNKYKILRSSSDPEEAHLIVVWNEDIIYQYLQEKPDFVFPKPRALYVVLFIFKENSNTCEDKFERIGNLLRLLWEKFNILNVILQAPCSCNSDDIYMYKPFAEVKQSRGFLYINKIDQILINECLIINQIRDMHGTPLNISLFERKPTSMFNISTSLINNSIYMYAKNVTGFYGLDANIVAWISNILNFKIHLNYDKNMYYGRTLDNGSITGSLGQVVRREVHLSANGRFVADYGTSGIEFTRAISSEKICVIVPKAQRQPHWMTIFYCFEKFVWLFIIIVIVTATGVWYLHQIVNKNGKNDIFKACLDICSICLSVPAHIPSNGAQIFLGSIMLFNVVISGIFQGNLIKSLSKSIYFPDINTLQELADSNLRIDTSLDVFSYQYSDVHRKLHQKVEYSRGDISSIYKTAYFRTWAAIERKSDAKLVIYTNYTDEKGEPLLHIVNECPCTEFLAYIVPAGSPLLPTFNSIIETFLEAGFIDKWNNDIVEAIINEKLVNIKYINGALRKLTVQDFQPAFFVIIVGYVMSLITLGFEICLFKRRIKL